MGKQQMVKVTASHSPHAEGLLPGANFRGSDPWPLERVFPLSPDYGPLYGDGYLTMSYNWYEAPYFDDFAVVYITLSNALKRSN